MCEVMQHYEEIARKEGIAIGREEGRKEGREQGREEGRVQGREQGREENLASNLCTMVEKGIDLETAMQWLDVPEDVRPKYRGLVQAMILAKNKMDHIDVRTR